MPLFRVIIPAVRCHCKGAQPSACFLAEGATETDFCIEVGCNVRRKPAFLFDWFLN